MQTVVIQTRNKSDVKFLMDFAQRIGIWATTVNTEHLEDTYLVSLIEKGLKTEDVSREEIMNVLNLRYAGCAVFLRFLKLFAKK